MFPPPENKNLKALTAADVLVNAPAQLFRSKTPALASKSADSPVKKRCLLVRPGEYIMILPFTPGRAESLEMEPAGRRYVVVELLTPVLV